MHLHSKQLNQESTDPEKDNCTNVDNDFVAECSSADNSIHTHTSTIGDVSVVCSAKDEGQEWKAPIGGSDDRD
jgi:hypothetical protein